MYPAFVMGFLFVLVLLLTIGIVIPRIESVPWFWYYIQLCHKYLYNITMIFECCVIFITLYIVCCKIF